MQKKKTTYNCRRASRRWAGALGMGGAEGSLGRSQAVARGGRARCGELSAAALTGPPRWLHPSAR